MGPNHYYLQKTQEGILKKATMGFIFLVFDGLLFSQSLLSLSLSLSLIVALFNDPMERTYNNIINITLYDSTALQQCFCITLKQKRDIILYQTQLWYESVLPP